LVLHWQGGDHTEPTLEKTRTGKHRYVTDTDTIELIERQARGELTVSEVAGRSRPCREE